MWAAHGFCKRSISRTKTSDKPEHEKELRPRTSGFGGSGCHALQRAGRSSTSPFAVTADAQRSNRVPSGWSSRLTRWFDPICRARTSPATGSGWRATRPAAWTACAGPTPWGGGSCASARCAMSRSPICWTCPARPVMRRIWRAWPSLTARSAPCRRRCRVARRAGACCTTRRVLRSAPAPVQLAGINDHGFLVDASLGLYPDLLEGREAYKARFGRSRWVAFVAACATLLRAQRRLRLHIEMGGTVRLQLRKFRSQTHLDSVFSALHWRQSAVVATPQGSDHEASLSLERR